MQRMACSMGAAELACFAAKGSGLAQVRPDAVDLLLRHVQTRRHALRLGGAADPAEVACGRRNPSDVKLAAFLIDCLRLLHMMPRACTMAAFVLGTLSSAREDGHRV